MTQSFTKLLAEEITVQCRSFMCRRLRTLGWLATMSLVAGCSRDERGSMVTTQRNAVNASDVPRQRVVLQTDWFPQAEHGGYYQALARGFYSEAGLDVDILPGGPGSGIKLKVAKGDADFGMNRSYDVILAASRDLPLVIVAATMQHDPLALMVHDSSPVRTFADLHGRVVVGNVGLAYFAFLERKLGLKFEKRQTTYGIGEFLANPEVIQQCLVTSEPFFAQLQGKKVRTLPLVDAGYDSYDAVFCRRELIRTAPETVRAFVAATIRGWRDYMEGDPSPAHSEILKRNRQMSAELLTFSRREMTARKLVHGSRERGEDIGRISLPRIAAEIELLRSLQILEQPVTAEQVATTAFLPPKS